MVNNVGKSKINSKGVNFRLNNIERKSLGPMGSWGLYKR
jgi:hypothetical protein